MTTESDLFAALSPSPKKPDNHQPPAPNGGGSRRIEPGDQEWPAPLSELSPHEPPECLYLKGRALKVDSQTVAVVGTRRPTAAGVEATQKVVKELVEAGFTIVSGLAVGIDAVAHRAALDAGGYTVAVLGSGLDSKYPSRNRALKQEIVNEGTVLTEYPDGTEPKPHHFPLRNRIVVGLVKGVLVVEGGFKSGALITARLAIDANRHVWAVPGSFRNAMAIGPNELIRTGQAALVTEAKHVFEDISPSLVWEEGTGSKPLSVESLSPEEKTIICLLDDVPLTAERLTELSGLSSGIAALSLSRLEVRGFVSRRGAGYEVSTSGSRVRAAIEH